MFKFLATNPRQYLSARTSLDLRRASHALPADTMSTSPANFCPLYSGCQGSVRPQDHVHIRGSLVRRRRTTNVEGHYRRRDHEGSGWHEGLEDRVQLPRKEVLCPKEHLPHRLHLVPQLVSEDAVRRDF